MSDENSTNESGIDKDQIIKNTKEALNQTKGALKTLISDPIGGQGIAFNQLGQKNAIQVGIVLSLVFIISSFLLGLSGLDTANMFGMKVDVPMSTYFKILLFSIIPAASVFGTFLLTAKLFSKDTGINIGAALFSAGITMLPLAILFFCFKVLGLANFKIVAGIAVFAVSMTNLLINAALTDTYKLSSRQSFILTPTLLIVAGVVSSIIHDILM